MSEKIKQIDVCTVCTTPVEKGISVCIYCEADQLRARVEALEKIEGFLRGHAFDKEQQAWSAADKFLVIEERLMQANRGNKQLRADKKRLEKRVRAIIKERCQEYFRGRLGEEVWNVVENAIDAALAEQEKNDD